MRLLVLLLAVGSALSAQGGKREPFPRTDPYTKSAREKIEPAGYSSLGPFRFGDDHTTAQVETALEGVPLIWVETAHFKLGSGLPEYELPADKLERERLKGELEVLAGRLPDIKLKTKELDPWLRLHLLALRLETLYSDFMRHLGLRESEFPALGEDPGDGSRGRGPYLGMGGKFTVLVFERKADLARYGAAFLGARAEAPVRRHFPQTDAWLFATALEFLGEEDVSDSALTCELVAEVSGNLALGVRGPTGDVPPAVLEGLGHWFARRVDARFPSFAGAPAGAKAQALDWEKEVRARVDAKVVPSSAEMLAWDPAQLEWADHLVLWSRFDHLLTREDGAGGAFLRALKAPLAVEAGALTPEARTERACQALASAVGTDLAALDRAWSEWVLKTYAK